jgi:hypothetical protein
VNSVDLSPVLLTTEDVTLYFYKKEEEPASDQKLGNLFMSLIHISRPDTFAF